MECGTTAAHLNCSACCVASAQHRVQQQHIARGNVTRQPLIDDLLLLAALTWVDGFVAVYQDLAQLDALAALQAQVRMYGNIEACQCGACLTVAVMPRHCALVDWGF